MLRFAAPVLLSLLLSGCSYAYDVKTKVVDGRLTFDADPQWGSDCIRQVTIEAETGETVWQQSISHEDGCANTFPIIYGISLQGEQLIVEANNLIPENVRGQAAPIVAPKPLQLNTTYLISTTTGSTGYGCGRFRLLEDRKVESLVCT